MQPKQIPEMEILLAAIDPFFAVSTVLSARSVQTFLLVAQEEGGVVQDYARKAKTTQATMSRNLMDLAEKNRRGQAGYGLLIGRDSIEDRRLREYRLSDKGRALVRKIARQFERPPQP